MLSCKPRKKKNISAVYDNPEQTPLLLCLTFIIHLYSLTYNDGFISPFHKFSFNISQTDSQHNATVLITYNMYVVVVVDSCNIFVSISLYTPHSLLCCKIFFLIDKIRLKTVQRTLYKLFHITRVKLLAVLYARCCDITNEIGICLQTGWISANFFAI